MLSNLFFLSYLGVFGTTAAACVAGVWKTRRIGDRDARHGLRLLLLTCGAWAACHVGLLLAPTDWGAHLFYVGGLIIGFGTVWAWLYFCSAYTGRTFHRNPTVQRLSIGVFAVVALTKATNPFHGLYYTTEPMQRPFAYVAIDHHLLYWGSVLLAYMLAAIGFFMLAELLARTRGHRPQLAGLFGLVALPILMNGVGHATPWLLNLSHEPLGGAAFSLGALFLLSGRLEDAARAGRRKAPALVLSGDHRIQNYNKRASRLLPALRGEGAVGGVLDDVLPELAGALGKEGEEEGEIFELSGDEKKDRYVRPIEQSLPQSDRRLVLLTDVTKQETRLEALSSTMPGVSYEFRAEPGGEQFVAFIGEEADTLLGLEPDPDGFYERFVECIPASHREEFLRSVETAVEERSHWRQEVPFDRPDGDRIWLLGSAEPEEKGLGVLFRGLLLDVTERVEERRRREQVIRRVTDAIVEVDAEWRLTLVNDRAEALYGRAEEDLLGDILWDVLTDVKGTRFEKEFRRAMRLREPRRFEEHLAEQDRWFRVQVYPNADGGMAFYFDDITKQKERKQRLEGREQLLRSITENVSEGIYRSTAEEGIFYANSAYVEMFGYESLEELQSVDASTLYADPDERAVLFRKEKEQGGLDGVEVEFQRKDGSTFTGLLSTQRVDVPDGDLTYNDGFLTDITERKKRERRLGQAETLFQNAQDALFLIDVEGPESERSFTYRRVNPLYEKKFGHSEEEIRGCSLTDVFGEEIGVFLEKKCRLCTRRRQPLEYEEQVPLDTKMAYFRTRLAPVIVDGDVRQIVGTSRDITERKQREETLKGRRQKIEALYKATSGLLQIEGPDSVPDRILAVLQDVFDFPLGHVGFVEDGTLVPKEIVAEGLPHTPEPRPQPMEEDSVAARAIRAGEVVVVTPVEDLENEHSYGTLPALAGIPIGERGAVVIGARGDRFESFDLHLLDVLASYAALVLDRLEREETLIEAREEAEEASQLKSAMLANMSHEIRTPLMSMIGSADLLREDLEGEHADMVEQIFQSGQRLRGTLDSVLQLSRLESGAYELDDDPVYVDAILREVAQELQIRAYEKGVTLEVANCGGSIEAHLDATATRRIVTNLVENAIKFTPEDGRVQVRARYEDDETVLLEVEDTGVGIEADAQSEIFEAFKQESEGLNREYEGSGLGLSIVHRLTTFMDGTIDVESEKGEGTRFALRFPR